MNLIKTLFIADYRKISNQADIADYHSLGITNLFAFIVYFFTAIYGLMIRNYPLAICDAVGVIFQLAFLIVGRRGVLRLLSSVGRQSF